MLLHDLIPPAAPTSKPYHVLVLHGLGDSRVGWKPVAPYLQLPELGWCFAQAPQPYPPGWSWFNLDWERDLQPEPQDVHDSVAALRELVEHLEQAKGIPAERLFVLGFSQGCLMTLELGLTHHRRFAGLVGISGWIFDLAGLPERLGEAARDQRILMTHGREDGVVPIARTRPQIPQLQALGLQLTWREFSKDHSLNMEEELPAIRAFLRAGLVG